MISNIIVMAVVGFLIGWGFSLIKDDMLAAKDVEYNKLIADTQVAYELMSAELEDSKLRLQKVSYTILEQQQEIRLLKEIQNV